MPRTTRRAGVIFIVMVCLSCELRIIVLRAVASSFPDATPRRAITQYQAFVFNSARTWDQFDLIGPHSAAAWQAPAGASPAPL
jgi:hypothetical protein